MQPAGSGRVLWVLVCVVAASVAGASLETSGGDVPLAVGGGGNLLFKLDGNRISSYDDIDFPTGRAVTLGLSDGSFLCLDRFEMHLLAGGEVAWYISGNPRSSYLGCAALNDRAVAVADGDPGSIHVFDIGDQSNLSTAVLEEGDVPTGLAVDDSGRRLYVTAGPRPCLYAFDFIEHRLLLLWRYEFESAEVWGGSGGAERMWAVNQPIILSGGASERLVLVGQVLGQRRRARLVWLELQPEGVSTLLKVQRIRGVGLIEGLTRDSDGVLYFSAGRRRARALFSLPSGYSRALRVRRTKERGMDLLDFVVSNEQLVLMHGRRRRKSDSVIAFVGVGDLAEMTFRWTDGLWGVPLDAEANAHLGSVRRSAFAGLEYPELARVLGRP